jgi:hypothetical protein
MKKLSILLSFMFAIVVDSAKAQTARVQIIHNSPDQAAASVDIYAIVMGMSQKLLDDVNYRTASGFENVPAGVSIKVAFAPANSQSVADTVAGLSFNIPALTANENYIVIADGFFSNSAAATLVPFSLQIYTGAKQASTAGNNDLLIYHGVPFIIPVDVVSPITSPVSATLADDLAYKSFNSAGYITIPNNNYNIQLRVANNPVVIYEVNAPLQTLNFSGQSFTVLASGLLANTSLNTAATFGIFAVPAAGGAFVQLPAAPAISTARLQLLHNCADPLAATVDVWVNGSKAADDFQFRTATSFEEIPANTTLRIHISVPTSTDTISGRVATITAPGGLPGGASYTAIARGVTNPVNFAANPDAVATAFGLTVINFDEGFFNDEDTVYASAYHGATDAPTVDVKVTGGATLFNDLTYNEVLPANTVLPLFAADATIDLTDASGNTTIKRYLAPLSQIAGQSVLVFASGFLTPSANQNGEAFGMFASFADGQVIPLQEVPITSISESNNKKFTIYPNPANNLLNVSFNDVENVSAVEIKDLTGKTVKVLNNINGGNNVALNLEDLTVGYYFVLLTSNQNTISANKLIISR